MLVLEAEQFSSRKISVLPSFLDFCHCVGWPSTYTVCCASQASFTVFSRVYEKGALKTYSMQPTIKEVIVGCVLSAYVFNAPFHTTIGHAGSWTKMPTIDAMPNNHCKLCVFLAKLTLTKTCSFSIVCTTCARIQKKKKNILLEYFFSSPSTATIIVSSSSEFSKGF